MSLSAKSFYDFSVKNASDEMLSLSRYRGQVVLVVNVASRCGYTPQYRELEELQNKHSARGFVVIGFPCNQFGAQEPGSDSEIQEFCSLEYKISFPVMAKIEVNGEGADPLYKWLKKQAPGIAGTQFIKWNFTKFLIGRDGSVRGRFAPSATPRSIETEIVQALGED